MNQRQKQRKRNSGDWKWVSTIEVSDVVVMGFHWCRVAFSLVDRLQLLYNELTDGSVTHVRSAPNTEMCYVMFSLLIAHTP